MIVADVYAAGEAPLPGVDKEGLVQAVKAHGHQHVLALPDPQSLAPLLRPMIGATDYVICLGAGTITQWAYALPAELAALDQAE